MLTVLSQHTSDLNAERAFADLRRAFPGGWQQVVDAPTVEVADAIRSGGLANSKAPRIQAILREVRDREGSFDLSSLRAMRDDEARDYLIGLPASDRRPRRWCSASRSAETRCRSTRTCIE